MPFNLSYDLAGSRHTVSSKRLKGNEQILVIIQSIPARPTVTKSFFGNSHPYPVLTYPKKSMEIFPLAANNISGFHRNINLKANMRTFVFLEP